MRRRQLDLETDVEVAALPSESDRAHASSGTDQLSKESGRSGGFPRDPETAIAAHNRSVEAHTCSVKCEINQAGHPSKT